MFLQPYETGNPETGISLKANLHGIFKAAGCLVTSCFCIGSGFICRDC